MLEHDPEKWEPVFGKRSCSNKEGDDDSKKNNPTLMTAPAPVMVPEPRPGEAFVKLEKVTLTYGRGEHRLKALDETDLVVD